MKKLVDGEYIDLTPEEIVEHEARQQAHAAKYPLIISKDKFKRRLETLGQWVAVRDFLKANPDLWDDFIITTTLDFDGSLTVAIAAEQGWTQEQLKQLFRDSRR